MTEWKGRDKYSQLGDVWIWSKDRRSCKEDVVGEYNTTFAYTRIALH